MRIGAQPIYKYGTNYLDFQAGAEDARIDILALGLDKAQERVAMEPLPWKSKAKGYRAYVEAVEKKRKEQANAQGSLPEGQKGS